MEHESMDMETTTIASTENFMVWTADEPDEETTFHIELGNITVHLFQEEWQEFLKLVSQLS